MRLDDRPAELLANRACGPRQKKGDIARADESGHLARAAPAAEADAVFVAKLFRPGAQPALIGALAHDGQLDGRGGERHRGQHVAEPLFLDQPANVAYAQGCAVRPGGRGLARRPEYGPIHAVADGPHRAFKAAGAHDGGCIRAAREHEARAAQDKAADRFEGRRQTLQDVLIRLDDQGRAAAQQSGLQRHDAPRLFPKVNDVRPHRLDDLAEPRIEMPVPFHAGQLRQHDGLDVHGHAGIASRIGGEAAPELLPARRRQQMHLEARHGREWPVAQPAGLPADRGVSDR